ncbi:MAG: hypothetical protein M3371_02820, partial [Acidobacteriota bacterium]|nr:hypothetical protein [Acidobacteriota bacterium]
MNRRAGGAIKSHRFKREIVMQIESYDASKRDLWDSFVQSNRQAGIGHLSGLFALEEEVSAAMNRSVILFDEQRRVVGVLPLFETSRRELRFLCVRELSSGTQLPGGPLFSPQLSTKQQREALTCLS